ncbi:MAG: FAD-binding and (Fe-S)-binding domain-containing protein [Aggregatilineales bacterium]
MTLATPSDLSDLAAELGKNLSGDVRFDDTTRALYSTDASNYQITPLGVVIPRDENDVIAAHQIASRYHVPILPRGGGSSLAGQTVGVALVIDFSRYIRRVTSVNAEAKTVRVQAGITLAELNKQLAPLGLMYGPDPASASRATIGGIVGNNATGSHSILYGMSSDHVRSMDVILADGSRATLNKDTDYAKRTDQIGIAYRVVQRILNDCKDEIAHRYPKTWRTCAGYALNRLKSDAIDLAQLLVGTEGTLATTLEVELGLVPRPKMTRLAILHFDTLRASLDATPIILEVEPSAVELMDHLMLTRARETPQFARQLTFVEGDPVVILIVEFYGESDAELAAKVDRLKAQLKQHHINVPIVDAITPAAQNDVWTIRKAGLNLVMGIKGDHKPTHFVEDAAVPVDRVADYIDRVADIIKNAGTTFAIYAHASAGCLHVKPLINLKSVQGVRQYRQIGEAVADLVVSFGGTISGEHGEGLARGCFSEKLFGRDLVGAFREIKAAFDPQGLMNPGKMFDAPPMDDPAILRYGGTRYQTPFAPQVTRFSYAADGSFAQAVEMCNGSGECRKIGGGAMCPSFMATRDEPDSTRGRGNVLRLAMTGALGSSGVADQRVHEVLDLCLSCKACKAECPSSVDMAKLKAEALALYHDEHGTPLRSRMFAHIATLNALGSLVPGMSRITNAALTSPVTKFAFRRMGIATQRQMPLLARQTFRGWYFNRHAAPEMDHRPEVVLFDDTFLNYNTPSIGRATVNILEAVGFRVVLVNKRCCGRPAISKGLLDAAKSMARHNLAMLAPYAHRGVPIVGCEPSCVSALTDDYRDLLPGPDAEAVAAATRGIEPFIVELAEAGKLNLAFDKHPRRILFHAHCHQKALTGSAPTQRFLSLIPNATVSEIQSGCCGVAGSFGYEAEHYDLSIKIGEDRLLPAIREAAPETIIAAAGTSCREQIEHNTARALLHPVEVFAAALKSN